MSSSDEEEVNKQGKSPLPMCKYGEKCYRRNAQHLQQYRHPKRKHDEDETSPGNTTKTKTKVRKIGEFFQSTDKKQTELRDEIENEEPKEESSSKKKVPENKTGAQEETSEEVLDDSHGRKDAGLEQPESPSDLKENIKRKFLVEMPKDFYDFWDFCKSVSPEKPTDALLDTLGCTLVGPYSVIAGAHKGRSPNEKQRKNFLTYCRYYYDPPEFLTVVKGDEKTQFHIGYYRDDPREMPNFVAVNSAKVNSIITPRGDNLFAAIKFLLEERIKDKSTQNKDKFRVLQSKLTEWAEKCDLLLELKTKSMKARDKKVVCKTFHGAGIVVPVDGNDVGYRPVPESPADLRKMLKKIHDSKTAAEKDKHCEPLQELITLVQFANDECDYGEGLELGLDLFTFGGECFHHQILHLLPLAYQLLGRHVYAEVVTSHLKERSSDIEVITSL